LYALAAVLLATETISLTDLLPYLSPSVNETAGAANLREELLRNEIRAHGIISLTNLKVEAGAIGGSGGRGETGGGMNGLGGRMPSSSSSSALPLVPPLFAGHQGSVPALVPPKPVAPFGAGSSVGGNGLAIAPGLFSSGAAAVPPPPLPFGVNRRYNPNRPNETDESSSSGGVLSVGTAVCDLVGSKDLLPRSQMVEERDDKEPHADGNQVIGLLSALISLRCWNLGKILMSLLEAESSTLDVVQFPVVREALCDLILWATDDVYYPLSFSKLNFSLKKGEDNISHQSSYSKANQGIRRLLKGSPEELYPLQAQQMTPFCDLRSLPSDVYPLLATLKHHVSCSPSLYSRICRLLEGHIILVAPHLIPTKVPIKPCKVSFGGKGQEVEDKTTDEETLKAAVQLISTVLLPGLTVSNQTPFFSLRLWRTLSFLPFQMRFALYDSWKGAGLAKEGLGQKNSEVVMAETEVLYGAKYNLKRLAKENVKAIGMKLGVLSHVSPIVVYSEVLNQIEAFDNLIPYVVDALKCSTKLSNDVLAYCILNQLRKDSDKLKQGDTHYSSWFSALAKFTATFYRKYPATELKGIVRVSITKDLICCKC
jgi:hypothetical protein